MRLGALPRRFDRRTAIGLACALAAGILVFALTRPEATVPVLVAEGPLPAGVPLKVIEWWWGGYVTIWDVDPDGSKRDVTPRRRR